MNNLVDPGLLKTLTEIRDRPIIYNAQLRDLTDEHYRLTQPILVKIEKYPADDSVIAVDPELEVFGEGTTETDAILNLKYAILGLYDDKLSLEPSQAHQRAPHPVFWYVLDGKKQLRITLPNIHGGSGSISTGFLKQVKENLRLSNQQFVDLIACPLDADQFAVIIRKKGGKGINWRPHVGKSYNLEFTSPIAYFPI
jgi:hypothetical protein